MEGVAQSKIHHQDQQQQQLHTAKDITAGLVRFAGQHIEECMQSLQGSDQRDQRRNINMTPMENARASLPRLKVNLWRMARKQRIAAATADQERQQVQEEAKMRWSIGLRTLVIEANMLSVAHMSGMRDPQLTLHVERSRAQVKMWMALEALHPQAGVVGEHCADGALPRGRRVRGGRQHCAAEHRRRSPFEEVVESAELGGRPSHAHPGRICQRSTESRQSCSPARRHGCAMLLWAVVDS